jgi:phosphatidylserine decarboxylase
MTLLQTSKNWFLKSILYLFPKNIISCLMGKLVSLQFSPWFVQRQIHFFACCFGINWDDVRYSIDQFSSLQSFFIRELKKEKRPIDMNEKAIVSPCDGAYGESGLIKEGKLLQVKGRLYSAASLLGDSRLAAEFEGGTFSTFYLSPRDYHRFHSPFSAKVLEAVYLPGHLWPVNPWAVNNIDQLFCVNERLVSVLSFVGKDTPAALMVAVGATMVGKVRVQFDKELATNTCSRKKIHRIYRDKLFLKGEELGLFEFGSTIVLLIHPKAGRLDMKPLHTEIKMGQSIGDIL